MTTAKRVKKPSYKKPESVKELERLANEKEFARYPNFPYPVKACSARPAAHQNIFPYMQ